MMHRGRFEKGKFLVGQPYSATLSARAEACRGDWPSRGQYVMGAPVANAPLPPDLALFADSVAAAGPPSAPKLGDIDLRLAEARRQLERLRARVRRGK